MPPLPEAHQLTPLRLQPPCPGRTSPFDGDQIHPAASPVTLHLAEDPVARGAFGGGHIGMTLGPVSGRITADLVAGRDPGVDLSPYALDR